MGAKEHTKDASVSARDLETHMTKAAKDATVIMRLLEDIHSDLKDEKIEAAVKDSKIFKDIAYQLEVRSRQAHMMQEGIENMRNSIEHLKKQVHDIKK